MHPFARFGSSLSPWWLAIRPRTLPVAVAPVAVGSAVAAREGGFAPLYAVIALLVALLLQIAANLANDLYDFRRGADTADRLGPLRVTQSGLIAPERMRAATVSTLGLATLAGALLVVRGGWPILVLGLLALLSAVAYTGGPAPLAYLGLGELFAFLFFGPVAVVGAAYVQRLTLTPTAVAASLPVGAIVAAVLVLNNLRDRETDRAAGKRTLAVRAGDRATRWEYAVLVGIAYLVPPLGWAAGVFPPTALLAWVTLPRAMRLVGNVWRASGRALNPFLGATAILALRFAVPFALGLALP